MKGRDQAGWSSQGDFIEEERVSGGSPEAVRLPGSCLTWGPAAALWAAVSACAPEHSSPVPRTRKGQAVRPPPAAFTDVVPRSMRVTDRAAMTQLPRQHSSPWDLGAEAGPSPANAQPSPTHRILVFPLVEEG